MKKISVTAVSYLNTKPFLYGLFKSGFANQIDLQLDIPSDCARKLQMGVVDLGLVPVAVIPELDHPQVISDFCIGAVGKVRTVCIYGDCPLQEMTEIYLDYHSKTSVELARVLLKHYWKAEPILLPADPGFEERVGGRIGALVIGDRTIPMEQKHKYIYDFGEAWQQFTGLPFVFAAWVSNRTLPESFLQELNEALALGISLIPELTYIIPQPHPNFNLQEYFTHYISYDLDAAKKEGLKRFLSYISPAVSV